MSFFSLFKKNSKNIDESKKELTIIMPFPCEVEEKKLFELTDRQYELLYERFENDLLKFEETSDELETAFNCGASYSERLRLLKSTCKCFDRCFDRVAPYWYQDKYFMEGLNIKKDDPWKTVDETNSNGLVYDFLSINCLRWLLNEYTVNAEKIKEQLKEIKI